MPMPTWPQRMPPEQHWVRAASLDLFVLGLAVFRAIQMELHEGWKDFAASLQHTNQKLTHLSHT